jgi:hypothetical protein
MYLNKYLLGILILLMLSCSGSRNTTAPDSKTPERSAPEIERPIPYPVDLPDTYARALATGTRTLEGKPGPNYWTQWSEYEMDLKLDTENKTLIGSATITYYNNSPDTLRAIAFELAQNLHKEGSVRLEPVEITGGTNVSRVALEGTELEMVNRNRPGYYVQGTNMIVILPEPLLPNDSRSIEIDWDFKIPQRGAGARMGWSQDNLFYLAYYYPHVRVYDDLEGWFLDTFTSNAEFYHGFGNYTINITAPEQWLVMSTGELLNADEVLSEEVYARYQEAGNSDEVITIAGPEDLGSATLSSENGELTWSFRAENVRDVAFSATLESQWDGVRTPVGDLDGDGNTDYSRINSFWRQLAHKWDKEAEFAAHAIKFLSEYTEIPYPWPHMTSVEGSEIIGGGMEFPMMTLMGDYNRAQLPNLYDVTAHELAHMWMPMIVSSNERRHAWMDEGSTTFHEANARWDYYPDSKSREREFSAFLWIAGTDYEGPIMRWSDYHYPGPAYGVASYPKPGSGLIILQGILGEELFHEAWTTYMKDWAYKHPTPYDMFNTFNTVSGQNLDYFWRGYYFETWVMDQAVESVTQKGNTTTVTIKDNGNLILPVLLSIQYADGSSEEQRIDAEAWLKGSRTASLTLSNGKEVSKVTIDKDIYFPDVERSNNTWER